GLANHFQRAVGVDVASSMIERARALNQEPRCSFVVNRSAHLMSFCDGEFTAVYSRLVLQHIRPALVRRYIPELVRVLARGGVLMFQLPEVIRADDGDVEREAVVSMSAGPEGAALRRRRTTPLGRIKRHIPWPIVVAWREMKYRSLAGLRTPEMQMY